jgi:hypothetical protein
MRWAVLFVLAAALYALDNGASPWSALFVVACAAGAVLAIRHADRPRRKRDPHA